MTIRPAHSSPRFLDCGETALSVEFGDAVDLAIHERVLALDDALRALSPKGVLETTPTYRALLIRYEPLEISRGELIDDINEMVASRVTVAAQERRRFDPARSTQRWILPCCYDSALAEDINEAAAVLGLSPQALAKDHAAADHRAYMYGFAPGWLYLGEAPARLRVSRRTEPRGPTPQGAILIGGGLSLIAANPMPTGWYVIGRTPERTFSLARDPNFLIAPGDAIQFEPIDSTIFAVLESRAEAGELIARRIGA